VNRKARAMDKQRGCRTLVVTEVAGDVLSSRIDAALRAAGLHPRETTSYHLDRATPGIESASRPDQMCRHCGWIGETDYDERGYCIDCCASLTHREVTQEPQTRRKAVSR